MRILHLLLSLIGLQARILFAVALTIVTVALTLGCDRGTQTAPTSTARMDSAAPSQAQASAREATPKTPASELVPDPVTHPAASATAALQVQIAAVCKDPSECTALRECVARIEKGGPYPYDRDGVVFRNFERRLPARARDYYHEYTVPTDGVRHRGARRIITGKNGDLYYTRDHYESFTELRDATK
jgi:ribonuclease T1